MVNLLLLNKEGAISGMTVGILSMLFYMLKFKFDMFGGGGPSDWWIGKICNSNNIGRELSWGAVNVRLFFFLSLE